MIICNTLHDFISKPRETKISPQSSCLFKSLRNLHDNDELIIKKESCEI